jgi:hypothetical protein
VKRSTVKAFKRMTQMLSMMTVNKMPIALSQSMTTERRALTILIKVKKMRKGNMKWKSQWRLTWKSLKTLTSLKKNSLTLNQNNDSLLRVKKSKKTN